MKLKITPKIAREGLATNNRKLNESLVEQYVQDVLRGRFSVKAIESYQAMDTGGETVKKG